MALPALAKTWTISANNRIVFVSLTDTMQRYLHGVKTFLKAGGYTVKGSSSTGIGAMDAVDRWTLTVSVSPQAANTTSPVAWMVLTDGNGCDILLSYVGATADIARISFSPGGLYVAAGTPNQTPTATDEVVILSGVSLINSTTSADRLWNGWRDSENKLCRFAIARSGVWVGQYWGVELVDSKVTGPPATWTPAVWGFGIAVNASSWANQATVGFARPVVASVGILTSARFMAQVYSSSPLVWNNIKPENQGGLGYAIYPISIGSITTGASGKLGALYDWWFGRQNSVVDGDTYGTLEFIVHNAFQAGGMWPWDRTTAPVLT